MVKNLVISFSPLIAFVLLWIFIPVTSQQEEVAVWIPLNAEILPSSQVPPGTFKVTIPLQEMQKTASPEQRIMIVVGDYINPDPHLQGYVKVDYWMPRENGVFYLATQIILLPTQQNLSALESFFTSWSSKFDAEHNMISFSPGKISALASFMAGSLCILGVIAWSFSWMQKYRPL